MSRPHREGPTLCSIASYEWTFRKNGLLLLALCSSLVWYSEAATLASKKLRVCVLGAGPAGLASLSALSEYADEFDIVAFEKSSDTGGLWIYTDSTDVDEHNLPVHSSMYKNLRTNFPKELMAYPDYQKFRGEERSCVTHQTVLAYLRNYTDHYNLRPYIKFDTLIEKVIPTVSYGDWQFKWQVESRNLNTNQTCKCTCDAVMVANGHYSIPKIPVIPGLENFPGKVMHSHIYRKPEEFAGKTVVVLGASVSGVDISLEIAEYAKKVYLSHNHDKIKAYLASNIEQVSGVLSADGNTLTLKDGSTITADTFIFCTGFQYAYPFLDNSSGVSVEKNHLVPLYKHLINIEYPTMSFVGLPRVLNYPMFYAQSRYVVSLLRGQAELPSKKDMLEDSRVHGDDFRRDLPYTSDKPWEYFDELAKLAGVELVPAFYRAGYVLWSQYKANHVVDFKEANLIVYDNYGVEIA